MEGGREGGSRKGFVYYILRIRVCSWEIKVRLAVGKQESS